MSEVTTTPSRAVWPRWVRLSHRWISVAFVLSVIATSIALAQAEPIRWMSYVPLFPLLLLFLTGTYLFALPYFARWHRRGRAAD
jgi:predicted Na+-dependent transporter